MRILQKVGIQLSCVALAFVSHLCFAEEASQRVDFDKHIRPILSDRCFACHGPDETDLQAELRFDQRDSAMRASEYGERDFVIKPGSPENSEIMLRLTTSDPNSKMPPPDSHLRVSAEEIRLIKQWIKEGAEWTGHWAFEPIELVDPPTSANDDWSRGPIDRFVLAQLRELVLEPTEPAAPELLARRLYFHLTGLPPSVAQLDEFLADTSDQAYESLVDRLLADQRFGERMAVDWLDVARYSDTHGYQLDFESYVWPYRDWVVNAFNKNLPYDQFITWQLAGDLLPNASREQKIATAFNRLHRQTNEGGSVDEEFRLEYVADRVDTFGIAFLGLSVGCARCHDHRFDPISQKEYYQLSAFFDNIDEMGVFSYFTKATPSPALELPSESQAATLSELTAKLQAAVKQLAAAEESRGAAFERWLSSSRNEWDFDEELNRGLIGHFPCDEIKANPAEDGPQKEDSGDSGESAEANAEPEAQVSIIENVINAASNAESAEAPSLVPGKQGSGLLLNGDNGFTTSVTQAFNRHEEFSFTLWLKIGRRADRATILHTTQASTDAGNRGVELVIVDGMLEASLVHYWPGNALRIRTVEPLSCDQWVHIAMVYDGSSQAEGVGLFLDGKRAEVEVVRDGLTRTIRYTEKDQVNFEAGNPQHHLTVGHRYRDRGLAGGMVDELQVFDRELHRLEVTHLAGRAVIEPFTKSPDDLTAGERGELFRLFLDRDESIQQARNQVRKMRIACGEARELIESMMVMKELPTPRQTYLLNRGAYDAKGESVKPGVISKVLPWNENLPRDRIGLARWLTDPKHPLTGRVAVNRIWQSVMGRGLVATQEDFGSQGTRPAQPELLDYLARDFLDHGWDVKRLVKQIVMSATYRQGSVATPKMREQDPSNDLMSRGPSYRLPAEMIRDGALAASGLLVDRVGGPPVKPYQPLGLWQESMNIEYQRDKNEGSRRRSIYSYWKRTLPPPAMITFDAAKREMCEVRRHATTTPLQALVLLNDPQYVEAARAAAETAMSNSETTTGRVRWLYRSFTSRFPSDKQQEVFAGAYREQASQFKDQPEMAEEFLAMGDHEPNESVDRIELAAWTVVAQMMLNLDYFVVLR